MKNRLLPTKMPRRIFLHLTGALNKSLFLLLAAVFIPGCHLFDGDKDPNTVQLSQVAEGLTQPIALAEAPDGSGRLFIVDQSGLIRVITPDGKLQVNPFLDLRDKIVTLNPGYDERGVLGLAFHPNYATNGRFFVYYSAPLRAEAPAGWNHTGHISEFKVSAGDPLTADKSSEKVLLYIDKPQSNHNGGTLAFGPSDHFLYISIGDGGAADDNALGHVEDWYAKNAGGNGQDITHNLLGNILRIDVDGGAPYAIPADNPFVNKEGMDEIYAYGFRNPYRFSFDMADDHRLFVGDVGQNLWEEIDIVNKGGNYGWNVKEGTHCFDTSSPDTSLATCPTTDSAGNLLIEPVIELKNSNQPGGLGFAIVGGYVYRGQALSHFNKRYIFGTWSASQGAPDGLVFVASSRPSGLWNFEEIKFNNTPTGRLKHYLLGFGQDSKGEVYLLASDALGPTGNSGKVFKLTRHSHQKY